MSLRMRLVALLVSMAAIGGIFANSQGTQALDEETPLWWDTHYGYVNLANWHLTYTANTCSLVTTDSTMFSATLDDGPGSVADCLRNNPSIEGLVIKIPDGTVTLPEIESMFTASWLGHNPSRWMDMPAQFPDVTFIMQIGNEPANDANIPQQDPWQVGWHQINTIQNMQSTYGSGRPNLYYAAALGVAEPTHCGVDQATGTQYCGLDYIDVLANGHQVCEVGWGCTFHRYWWNLSGGYNGGPPHASNLVNWVQNNSNIPRAIISEQGIDANPGGSTYIRDEDCALRNYTNQYPSKIRAALTYIVYSTHDGMHPDGWFTYGITSQSDIC